MKSIPFFFGRHCFLAGQKVRSKVSRDPRFLFPVVPRPEEVCGFVSSHSAVNVYTVSPQIRRICRYFMVGMWVISVELKDAYLHISIYMSVRMFLWLTPKGRIFLFSHESETGFDKVDHLSRHSPSDLSGFGRLDTPMFHQIHLLYHQCLLHWVLHRHL